MIASLSGIVKATSSSHAVIEVGGIGYGVALPARLAVSLVVGASVVDAAVAGIAIVVVVVVAG